jgi:hypothetical protein
VRRNLSACEAANPAASVAAPPSPPPSRSQAGGAVPSSPSQETASSFNLNPRMFSADAKPEEIGKAVQALAASEARSATGEPSADIFQKNALAELIDRQGIDDVATRLAEGDRLVTTRTMSGKMQMEVVKPPIQARPRIAIVEIYELSSHLGNYGAGRTLKTFSLLPGEEIKTTIKTYRRTSSIKKEAECIVDQCSGDTEDQFGIDIQDEHQSKQQDQSDFKYNSRMKADATWGWGSANVSARIAGSSGSTREEFGKSVESTTNKHISKASRKRDIDVNTSSEEKVEQGDDQSIERTLKNINWGRVLNFVYRQMNQEYVTVLSLIDVRVAFSNEFPDDYREFPISNMDALLTSFVKPNYRTMVKDAIKGAIYKIRNYR